MQKTLAFLLSLFLISSSQASFSDADEIAINYVQNEGIVDGYPDGRYLPERAINRAEFTKIIVNSTFDEEDIENCELPSELFPDFDHEEWFSPYVCLAQQEGIIEGYPDGEFKPAQNINVVEAAKIIALAYGEEESSTEPWYEPYMQVLDSAEALPTSLYSLSDKLTRHEMAEFIYRLQNEDHGEDSRSYEELLAGPSAPNFTRTLEETRVEGAPLWLFATEDKKERLVLSMEVDQSIKLSFFDSENPKSLDWTTVANSENLDGNTISDHWHIYAHGYHWLSMSTPQARTAYLLQLNDDWEQIKLIKTADDWRAGDFSSEVFDTMSSIVTNDHWMTKTKDGVAIGYSLIGWGSLVVEVNMEGEITRTELIGSGDYRHGNGSAALTVDNHYLVLAADTIAQPMKSRLRGLLYDEDWNEISAASYVDQSSTNFSMNSGVMLPNGYLVTVSRYNNIYGNITSDDHGGIIRYVIDPDGQVVSSETFRESGAYRPHLALAGNQLITTWDERGNTYIVIDELSY